MFSNLSQYTQLLFLFFAAFFSIWTFAGLVNLYLRFIDQLSIDRQDVLLLRRNVMLALFSVGLALLFYYLPYPMALTTLFCGIVLYQLLHLSGLLKKLNAANNAWRRLGEE
jgi:hypothetical protein